MQHFGCKYVLSDKIPAVSLVQVEVCERRGERAAAAACKREKDPGLQSSEANGDVRRARHGDGARADDRRGHGDAARRRRRQGDVHRRRLPGPQERFDRQPGHGRQGHVDGDRRHGGVPERVGRRRRRRRRARGDHQSRNQHGGGDDGRPRLVARSRSALPADQCAAADCCAETARVSDTSATGQRDYAEVDRVGRCWFVDNSTDSASRWQGRSRRPETSEHGAAYAAANATDSHSGVSSTSFRNKFNETSDAGCFTDNDAGRFHVRQTSADVPETGDVTRRRVPSDCAKVDDVTTFAVFSNQCTAADCPIDLYYFPVDQ